MLPAIFTLPFCYCSIGQEVSSDALFLLTGIVYDADSLKPLPNVHLVNQQARRGTTSNERGEFAIALAPFDTLLITIVGYADLQFFMEPDAQPGQYMVQAFMEVDTFSLREFTVTGHQQWQDFKNEFVQMAVVEQPKIDLGIAPSGQIFSPSRNGIVVNGVFTYIYERYDFTARKKRAIERHRKMRNDDN